MRTLFVLREELLCPVCDGAWYEVLDSRKMIIKCRDCGFIAMARTLSSIIRDVISGDLDVKEDSLLDRVTKKSKDSGSGESPSGKWI